ncbi:MAG: PolC-type DNA polymerase III [Acholeplasmatales bacterium]|nr:MAG: PolC-type DNA polymerase III [Acholeplasmatales bacterium]
MGGKSEVKSMSESLERVLEFLHLEDEKEAISGRLIELSVDEARREWFFNIELEHPLPIEVFTRLQDGLENVPYFAKACDRVTYEIDYVHQDFSQIDSYYHHILNRLIARRPRYEALKGFPIEKNGNQTLHIVCPRDGTYVEDMLIDIEQALAQVGFEVTLDIRYCQEAPAISDRIASIDHEEVLEAEVEHAQRSEQRRYLAFNDRTIKKINHTIDHIPITEAALIEYKSSHHKADFTIEAMVISSEERKINAQTILFTFVLSDSADSIYVKKFVRDQEEAVFLRATQPNMMMKVKGSAAYDTFADEVVLTAIVIERTDRPVIREIRQDDAPTRRVELHLHTKMSTLDGIDSIEDYVDTALRFKHKAIALTDRNSAQAFPEFFKATRKKPIKPIYGVEFSIVDEADLAIARGDYEGDLDKTVFTVFDVETTHLSVKHGKIIEISAVKIKNHQVVETFNRFVNPHETLSSFTRRLTGITQQQVDTAEDLATVLPAFKAFFTGTVMVAHNAPFDMGHIHEALRELDVFDGPYPHIDTLQIARQCYANDLKRFNLKAVAKYFKVELKHHHRAEHDARATADIFLHMLDALSRQGIKTFSDLKTITRHLPDVNIYAHAMPTRMVALVKTQAGLKNLYRLVTLANTDYFHKEPMLPKKVLDAHREGLLLGSGFVGSDVFEAAFYEDDDALMHKAAYYDYLEVQPEADMQYLGEGDPLFNQTIAAILKRTIAIGEQLNTPIIAASNAYHIEQSGVKYRDIYVKTPVVGGGLHPLAHRETIPSQYFRTTTEMLQAFPTLKEETVHRLVIDAPVALSEQIDHVQAFSRELFAPTDDFLASEGIPSIEKRLLKMVRERAKDAYGEPLHPLIAARLDKELTAITTHQFSTVYYISHLLVKKSLDDGYLVGSRGSVGSSLVATLMAITEVNPLPPHYVCPKCYFTTLKMAPAEAKSYGIHPDEQALQQHLETVSSGYDLPTADCPRCGAVLKKDGHDIPFETFLGFKGDKVPDIDLNFSGDYQPIVHEYIRTLFGAERAFRAGTISTVAAKTAIGYVKGYLEKQNETLRKAEIERRAKVIAGVKRSTGQHPGGIVVVPSYKDIHDVTPVQYPADATDSRWKTTHFDYHSFEDNLFKLDVLGHDDPTMIRYLMDFVKADPISFPFKDATDIPLDDPKVYALLSGTEVIGLKPGDLINTEVASFGVPEMGTPFVRGMLRDSRPKTFADIVKISGLSHGTDVWLNNAETLVTGKNPQYGKIPFKEVIGCRDDIMVTLIQHGLKSEIAFEISEFIRKGRAAVQPEKWDGYAMIMREHNLPDWYIWSAGQIKYMFPKAHATAYVMMALRIAWFKVYRPIYFYSAYFSKRARDFDLVAMQGGEYALERKMRDIHDAGVRASEADKRLYTVLEVAHEMVKRGFTFEPVDIVQSAARDFVVSADRQRLRLPFIALDGLGLKVAQSLVDARDDKAFSSRDDVKMRTSLSSTLFDKLDALGAFGELPESGQMSLFD